MVKLELEKKQVVLQQEEEGYGKVPQQNFVIIFTVHKLIKWAHTLYTAATVLSAEIMASLCKDGSQGSF